MLSKHPAISSCKVALMAERAEVQYDPLQLTDSQITEMIDDMGFEASVLKEDAEGSVDLRIFGMTCASCSSTIEREVGKMDGMKSVSINLLGEQGHFVYDKSKLGVRDIVEKIEDLGFDALWQEQSSNSQIESLNRTREIQEWRTTFWKSFAFSFPVFVISMFLPSSIVDMPILRGLTLGSTLMLILTLPVQFGVGHRFYVASWKALSHRSYTMDVLIVLGTTIAFCFSVVSMIFSIFSTTGQPPEVFFETCASLITFVTLGRYLENVAKGKTSAALSNLMTLTPSQAVLLKTDPITKVVAEKQIPTEFIQPGDLIKVVPGERIPADGVVVLGKTNVDEALVTGESKPVGKNIGDAVIAGTVNGTGMIHFKATRVGSDTTLAQILKLVNEAQTSKAPIQDLADTVAGYFVPGVMILGLTTFVFWSMVFMCTSFWPSNFPQSSSWIYIASKLGISVIVVACPCALGLATPTAVMVGTGVGATLGILIKGGRPLTVASKLTKIVFDKTGTLTMGKMQVVRHTNYLVMGGSGNLKALSDEKLMALVGCAEEGSEHSIGKSLHAYCKKQVGDKPFTAKLESFDALPGLGVKAIISSPNISSGTLEVLVGNEKLLNENGCTIPAEHANLHKLQESEGLTVVFVAIDSQLAATFALADQLKAEALGTVHALRAMGLEICMITGDQQLTAEVIGKACGISEVHAGVSPQGKKKLVERMQRAGHVVGMIGDGVNDSASIAQSDLGMAVYGGTDVAIEAAGVVLMRENLLGIVAAIDLCRKIYGRIKLNFVWATV
jgi:Cu+-exporting ATPase